LRWLLRWLQPWLLRWLFRWLLPRLQPWLLWWWLLPSLLANVVLVATVIASGAAQVQLICPASAGLFLCALSSLLVSARTAEPQLDVRFGSKADSCTAAKGIVIRLLHWRFVGDAWAR